VTLTLVFDLFIKNSNLGYIFWMVCTRNIIFDMSFSPGKSFPRVPTDLTLWPWPWCLTYILKKINHVYNFWTACIRTLRFHKSTCFNCEKFFQLVLTGLALWPWSFRLTNFLKTLTLAISFEFVTRPFRGYQHILPYDLDLDVLLTYQEY
jgi:hypothetical protein